MRNGINPNQLDLFIEKLGGREIWDEVLQGKKIVYTKEPESNFFDHFGRRIPEKNLAEICEPESEFSFDKIILKTEDYRQRISIFRQLGLDEITVQYFKSEVERLIVLISENIWINKILHGPCLPVIIPKDKIYSNFSHKIRHDLELAGESFKKFFPERKFSISEGLIDSSSEITINQSSRQERLLEMIVKKPLIGLYFPEALKGFSVHASREQMKSLPEGFYLSGIDSIWAMIMYPDILAKNFNVPGIYLSGLNFFSRKTLYFRVFDEEFSIVSMLGLKNHADGGTTTGLFFC